MQEFLHTYNVEILGCFGVMCFYLAVISIQDAIRKGADRIVLAITSLEVFLREADQDDHPMYRDPDR